MPFDIDNEVVVGGSTKADEYDTVFDNTQYLFKRVLGVTPADDTDAIGVTVGHNHEGSGEGVILGTDALLDNAITEAKVADTDLPAGFRVYMSTTAINPINWDNEDFDGGSDFDLANEKYVVPTTGVYMIGVQVTFLPSGGVGTYTVEIKQDSTVIATRDTELIGDGVERSILVTTLSKLTAADEITINVGRSGAGAGTSTGVAGTSKSFFYGYKIPWTTAY